MSELAACRMCLVADARMYTIANTPLQDVYERITDIPLQNGDTWPKKVCYICHHLLRKNQAFMEKSVKADELLRLVLDRGVELTEAYTRLTDTSKLCSSLGVSSPVFHNLGLQKQEEPAKEQPKREIEPSEDPLTGVRVKSEPVDSPDEMEIEIEGTAHSNESPENVGKGWTSPKQWTQTETVKEANESNYTEIICNVKLEIESYSDTEHSDTSPQQDNYNTQYEPVASPEFTPPNLFCEPCGIELQSINAFKAHKLKVHPISLVCEHCTKVCKTTRSFTRHVRTHFIKKEIQIHKCSLCDREFSQKKNLNQHMLIHTGEKPHRCSHCDKTFIRKNHLNQHMLQHTGEKPHQCTFCDKAFTMKNHLNLHLFIHTGEKPHRCSYCDKEFAQKTNLNRHLLTHTGEKLFQCHYCNREFTQKNSLNQHILRHTGEKPHRCSYCDKAFAGKNNLNRHVLIHTGEKPYRCGHCNKRFSQKNGLSRHMEIKHAEKVVSTQPIIKKEDPLQ